MDLSQVLPSLASLLVVMLGHVNLLRTNAATTCGSYILDLLAVFPPSEYDSAACSKKTGVVMTNDRSMGSALYLSPHDLCRSLRSGGIGHQSRLRV